MTMTVERLALNIQRSATSATSPAALALSKLGLSAKDFIGLNANEYILKIADAASKFNQDFNLSQALMALGGRGMQSLIPMLAQGREGLVSMEQSATFVGATLSGETVDALTSVHRNLVLLKSASEGASAALVARFATSINIVVTGLQNWITTAAQVTASGRVFENLIVQLDYLLQSWIINIVKAAAAVKALFMLDWDGVRAAWKSNFEEQQENLRAHLLAMGKIALTGQFALQGALKPPSNKPSVGALGFGADTASAALKAADDQVKVLQDGLARQKILLDQAVAQFQIGQGAKIAAVERATMEEVALEYDVLQKELTIGNLSAEQRQTVLNKISQLEQRYATETVKLNGETVAAVQAKWQEMGNTILSAFNSQLRGLLAGTTSWATAFKSILGDLVIAFIQAVEKMVVQWAVGKLTMATADKAATVESTAAAAAATAAQVPSALASIQQKVAQVYAGAAAFFAPLLGPGAPAAALGVSAEVDAAATTMAVASAETGAYQVSGGLWQLHDNETVLPAPAAQAFRDMAEGGGAFAGGGVHFHGMMVDGPSIAGLFRTYASTMAQALNGHMAMNPSSR
jgi:hypothetical protein